MAAVGIIALLLSITHWLSQKGIECYFLNLTGLHCPGCGGTRCAHDLMAGNWIEAVGHNALLAVGAFSTLALSVYLIVRITILGKPIPKIPNIAAKWLWIGAGAIALFTILRNIPAYPLTLLAP